jgi:hypothetical protein
LKTQIQAKQSEHFWDELNKKIKASRNSSKLARFQNKPNQAIKFLAKPQFSKIHAKRNQHELIRCKTTFFPK